MTQITIRGMDPELEQEIRRRAVKDGKSLNHIILDMISQHTGSSVKRKKLPGEPLKNLAGGWSEQDARDFMESIKSCEQIDGEITADRYSRIANQLKLQGNPIPTNDIWIAAQTMEHGAELITSDRHFEKINGLVCSIL
jgi:hypothetical protein